MLLDAEFGKDFTNDNSNQIVEHFLNDFTTFHGVSLFFFVSLINYIGGKIFYTSNLW